MNTPVKKKYAISQIISDVDCKYGAPMGRASYGTKPEKVKIFTRRVPLSLDSAYDKGGAYWGLGRTIMVEFTKDLNYVKFYRAGE